MLPPPSDHTYSTSPSYVALELVSENESLRKKVEELQHQLEYLQLQTRFGLQRLVGSDEDIRFYTRLVYDNICIMSVGVYGTVPHEATQYVLSAVLQPSFYQHVDHT